MRGLCIGEGEGLTALVSWAKSRMEEILVLTADPFWTPAPRVEQGLQMRVQPDVTVLRGNPRLPAVVSGLDLEGVESVFLAMDHEQPVLDIARRLKATAPAAGIFLVGEGPQGIDVSSAEPDLAMSDRRRKATALLRGIDPGDSVLVLTHNDPDPDALASAAALVAFLEHHGARARIGYGGGITRPENRKMVEVLELEIIHADDLDWNEFHHVAIVDGQPGPNSALPPGCGADIVIDHHVGIDNGLECRFKDIDDSFGSTATLLFHYLRAADVPIDSRVATALFYGIKTDTRMRGRDVKQVDLEALLYLRDRIDADALAEIEQVEYTPEIFRSLSDAARNATIRDGVLVSYLGKVQDRDTVAQAADFCTRVEGVRWVLVGGQRGEECIFSVRTLDARDHAGVATRRAFASLGSCGGRRPMAGGQIPIRNLVPEGRLTRNRVRDAMLERFCDAVASLEREQRQRSRAEASGPKELDVRADDPNQLKLPFGAAV